MTIFFKVDARPVFSCWEFHNVSQTAAELTKNLVLRSNHDKASTFSKLGVVCLCQKGCYPHSLLLLCNRHLGRGICCHGSSQELPDPGQLALQYKHEMVTVDSYYHLWVLNFGGSLVFHPTYPFIVNFLFILNSLYIVAHQPRLLLFRGPLQNNVLKIKGSIHNVK